MQHLEELVKKGGVLPDVIFLDMNFPGKNGFDFLNEFKTLCQSANVKSSIMI